MSDDIVARAKNFANHAHHKLGSSPLLLMIAGAACIFFWASGIVTQILTSEFLIQGSNAHITVIPWSVVIQPWLIISSQVPVGQSTAWQYAWIVELVTIIFGMFSSHAIAALHAVNPRIVKLFIVGAIVLIVVNAISDYAGIANSSIIIKGLGALACGGWVVVGLPVGIGLIEKGVEEW